MLISILLLDNPYSDLYGRVVSEFHGSYNIHTLLVADRTHLLLLDIKNNPRYNIGLYYLFTLPNCQDIVY